MNLIERIFRKKELLNRDDLQKEKNKIISQLDFSYQTSVLDVWDDYYQQHLELLRSEHRYVDRHELSMQYANKMTQNFIKKTYRK